MTATLTRDGDVFVLDLGNDENRFSVDWVASVQAGIDEVAAADGPRALLTVAQGKFFSNGLDLDWVLANPGEVGPYVTSVHGLYSSLLRSPVPTIAVIQGHCFAAGALLVLAQDFRYMRVDRGFFCLPEVDIDIPFSPGMSAMVKQRLAPQVAHEVMTTGRRYGGADAAAAGIVDAALELDELLPVAMAKANELAPKAGPTLQAIRTELYRDAIEKLEATTSLSFPTA